MHSTAPLAIAAVALLAPRGPAWAQQEASRPPPLHVDYASYGVAVTADVLLAAGATCGGEGQPCILGSGGGLLLRGGYQSAGPWYLGGAYQLSKTNSANIYRLATLQQLRAEMRYRFDLGHRTAPYATWGLGAFVYGNEWGVETGGGAALAGAGLEVELSRLALLGVGLRYQPMIVAAFVDTAGFERSAGLAQYLRIELELQLRTQLSRR